MMQMQMHEARVQDQASVRTKREQSLGGLRPEGEAT